MLCNVDRCELSDREVCPGPLVTADEVLATAFADRFGRATSQASQRVAAAELTSVQTSHSQDEEEEEDDEAKEDGGRPGTGWEWSGLRRFDSASLTSREMGRPKRSRLGTRDLDLDCCSDWAEREGCGAGGAGWRPLIGSQIRPTDGGGCGSAVGRGAADLLRMLLRSWG
jgi:hypothetical protein